MRLTVPITFAFALAASALVASAAARTDAISAPWASAAATPRTIDATSVFDGVIGLATSRTATGRTFVALAGRDGAGPKSIAVAEVQRSGSLTLIANPHLAASDVFLVSWGDRPCVGANALDTPRVTCLAPDGSWSEAAFEGRDRTAGLIGLGSAPAGPIALLGGGMRRGTPYVVQWNGAAWRTVGPPTRPGRDEVVTLGSSVPAGRPIVGITPGPRSAGARRVLGLRNGHWSDVVPPARGFGGAAIGGPISDGDRVWMAENDSRSSPNRFSVLVWRRGQAARRVRVSRGTLDAQGAISVVAGSLWASWRGIRQIDHNLFSYRLTTNVARIDRVSLSVRGRRNLWSGPLGLPLPFQVADINGSPYAAYLRAKTIRDDPKPAIVAVSGP